MATLLLVEDNEASRDALARRLERRNYSVLTAADGHQGVEIAQGRKPDLILMDLGMPGMDGYEAARRIREQPGLGEVVLAALTGWGQQEDRRRTAEAGFNHHVVKPPEPDALDVVLADVKRRGSR